MERVLTINKFLKIKTKPAVSIQTLTCIIDQTCNSPCNCFPLKYCRHNSSLEGKTLRCHSLLGYRGYFKLLECLNWVMSDKLFFREKQKPSWQLRWRLRSLKAMDLRSFPHSEPLCGGQCKLLSAGLDVCGSHLLVCLFPTGWEWWWGKELK